MVGGGAQGPLGSCPSPGGGGCLSYSAVIPPHGGDGTSTNVFGMNGWKPYKSTASWFAFISCTNRIFCALP